MRWERSSRATHTADFIEANGTLIPLTGLPTVTIRKPDGTVFVSGAATAGTNGVYSYFWDVPVDAVLGLWKVEWVATSSTNVPLTGVEWIEIVDVGYADLSEDVRQLRNLVDRRLPSMPEGELFFTDDEIHSLLVKNGGDSWLGAYEGWVIKAGVYADLIDVVEGGTTRRFSQRHKNAMSMAEFFRKKIDSDSAETVKASSRVAGKAFSLRNDPTDVFGIYTVAGINTAGLPYYVRTYSFFAGSGTLEEMAQRALTPAWYVP